MPVLVEFIKAFTQKVPIRIFHRKKDAVDAATKIIPPEEDKTTVRVTQEISPIKLEQAQQRHLRTDLVGKTLKGGYKIIEEIGRGGMAVVFKANHSIYGEVAVKVIDARNSNIDTVERFMREGKKLLKNKHPNIIECYELAVDEDNEVIFFSMKLVKNKTLHHFVDAKTNDDSPLGKTDLEKVLVILIKIANALHFIHEKGLTHRDVKPLNILLDGDEPYLADLGLARLTNETRLTTQGAIVGSPDHMAPEQLKDILDAQHNPIQDRRIDIYALGVILYELATGKNPFKSDTVAIALSKHFNEKLPPPNELNPNIDSRFSSYILTMLEIDPRNRLPQTAAQLAIDLQEFLDSKRKIWKS